MTPRPSAQLEHVLHEVTHMPDALGSIHATLRNATPIDAEDRDGILEMSDLTLAAITDLWALIGAVRPVLAGTASSDCWQTARGTLIDVARRWPYRVVNEVEPW